MSTEDSYYQVLESGQNLIQNNKHLLNQVSKLALANEKLQSENNLLKILLANKENMLLDYAQKAKQLSKTLIQLSKGILSKQDSIAQKNRQIQILKDNYQNQIKQVQMQKGSNEKQLKETQLQQNFKKEEVQRLKDQLKGLERRKAIRSGEFRISERQTIQKKLNQYKFLIKTESQRNILLESKVYELQAQLSRFRKEEDAKSKQRKFKSEELYI